MEKTPNYSPAGLHKNPLETAHNPFGSFLSMAELPPGQQGIITRVPPTDLLPELSIRTGKKVRIIARSVANGPILVRVDNRSIAIDLEIARSIMLDPGI